MQFVCYLDDSMDTGGNVQALSGYLSTLEGWLLFEKHARTVLQNYEVQQLRGKDFHNGHKDFKGWDGIKKSRFVNDLYKVVGEYIIHGLNSIVHIPDFDSAKKYNKDLENISPICLAFGQAVFSATQKDFLDKFRHVNFDICFKVESGHNNNGNIDRYFNWLKDIWPSNTHKLESLEFIGKDQCIAIQLADFLAFHGRREADNWASTQFRQKHSTGDAMKIMTKYVFHRHDRFFHYSDRAKKRNIALDDTFAALFVPQGGLK